MSILEALEPFANLYGEDDGDFPDDTPVVVRFGRTTDHSLTLGDIRRAAETYVKVLYYGEQKQGTA